MREFFLSIYSPENEFFSLTKGSKRITHIALSSFILPAFFIFLSVLAVEFALTPLVFANPEIADTSAKQILSLYGLFGIIILLVFLWAMFFEGRPVSSLGFTENNFLKKYLSGFTTGIIMNSALVGLMALFGSIEIAPETNALTGIDSLGLVVVFLFGFVIQGGSEEILTRGWMFQVIGARYKPWLGMIITSIFFSALHLGNSGVNFFAVINLFLFAILMTLYVMKDKSIWGACAWHSSWNWTMGNFYGLSVSGSGARASVFDLDTRGNAYISGGGFGPEGSIIASVILLIAISYFTIKIRKQI